MCYSRSWEAEEAKGTEQQAKDKQAQARRNERVNELSQKLKSRPKKACQKGLLPKSSCPRNKSSGIGPPSGAPFVMTNRA